MTSADKQDALDRFATFINPQKVRVMRAAGLDIIEGRAFGPVGVGHRRHPLPRLLHLGRLVQRRPAQPPRSSPPPTPPSTSLDNGNFLLCSEPEGGARRQAGRGHPGRACRARCSAPAGARPSTSRSSSPAAPPAAPGSSRPSTATTATPGSPSRPAAEPRSAQPFEPLMPEFVQVPFGDLDALAGVVDERHRRSAARADPGRGRDRRAACRLPRRCPRRLRPRPAHC